MGKAGSEGTSPPGVFFSHPQLPWLEPHWKLEAKRATGVSPMGHREGARVGAQFGAENDKS